MDRTSPEVLAFFSPFFDEEEQSVVSFVEAEVWVDILTLPKEDAQPVCSEQPLG